MRAPAGGANAAPSAAHRADSALREAYALRGSPPPGALDWDDYDALSRRPCGGSGPWPGDARVHLRASRAAPGPRGGRRKALCRAARILRFGGRRRAPDRHRRADQRRPALRLPRPGRRAGAEGHRPGPCGSRGQWLARGAGRLSPGDLCRAAHAAHGLPRSRIVHLARLLSRRFDRDPVRGAASRTRPPARAQRQQPVHSGGTTGAPGKGGGTGTTCSAARPSCSAAPGRPRNTPDPRRTRSCSTAPITGPVGRTRKGGGSTGTTCEHFSPIEPRPDAASTCGATGPR